MISPTQVLADLYRVVLLLATWVAQGVQYLACLLEPAQPPAELPLATLTPFPFCLAPESIPVTTGARSEDPIIEYLPLSPPRNLVTRPHCNLELNGAQHNVIHVEKRNVRSVSDSLKGDEFSSSLSERREWRAKLAPSLVRKDAILSPSTSPTQSVYYTPSLFDSLISAPLTLPCITPEGPLGSHEPVSEQRPGERFLKARKFEAEIGDLGRRRGFKGAPLFIQANRRSSLFLSLPNLTSRSPTSSTPTSPRQFTPRTPLSAVTNMIRSVSSQKPMDRAKGNPEDPQIVFDQDPFATFADTFFTSIASFGSVPSTDLDYLGSYFQRGKLHSRTPSLKRKSNFEDLRAAASPIKRTDMRTTLHDMSTSSWYRKEKLSSKLLSQEICASPKIVLTVPSAPSSPTKASTGVAGSIPDSGTKANIAFDMSHPNSVTSNASPPGLLPVNDLIGLHADDRSLLKKEKGDMFSDHDNPNVGTDDNEFVTWMPSDSNPYTSAVDITVYGPTQRESFYQNDSVNGGSSVKPLCKPDWDDKTGHLPIFDKILATKNLYNFDVYKNFTHLSPKTTHGEYYLTDTSLPTLNVELANMETTIYDLSVYSEDSQPPLNPAIGHTRRRVTTEPSIYNAQIDRNCSSQSNQKPIKGSDTSLPMPICKTSVLAVQPINRSGKVEDHKEALICFPPATQLSSSEKKRPSAASQISHVTNPSRGRRSQGLDEIIALLDACVSESSQGVVPARRSIALSDDLWDEGSLFELYAI